MVYRTLLWGLTALTVTMPAAAQATFGHIESLVERGIERGIYPGAVVVIGQPDRVLYARGFGHYTWDPTSPTPSPDTTLWDIASISKVVGTTTAIMLLVERDQVDLDARVSRYLPRFQGLNKDQVTVRMLLDHTSGLPSYVQFFKQTRDREEAIGLLYQEPLRRRPGTRAVYSDLNALLLGLLVEAVTGESLDAFAAREVFVPLGMTQTLYRPPRAEQSRAVPTGVWRGHPVGGQVNDQNAVVFGGAAGHAGIFSTGIDLARYAQMWLSQGRLSVRRFVGAPTIQRFLERRPEAGSRLLGWDTPEPTPTRLSVFGNLLSDQAYGHTGWTGTEMWVDPARKVFLVFLTNRSFNPKVRRSISELRAVRSALSDAVVRAVHGACEAVSQPAC
ncbi:MAG: beta-lactamase family protein [Gemmatimonadales bacterium]|nr:beta-lactamase family protein [Gemmatimonadales bacterium]